MSTSGGIAGREHRQPRLHLQHSGLLHLGHHLVHRLDLVRKQWDNGISRLVRGARLTEQGQGAHLCATLAGRGRGDVDRLKPLGKVEAEVLRLELLDRLLLGLRICRTRKGLGQRGTTAEAGRGGGSTETGRRPARLDSESCLY